MRFSHTTFIDPLSDHAMTSRYVVSVVLLLLLVGLYALPNLWHEPGVTCLLCIALLLSAGGLPMLHSQVRCLLVAAACGLIVGGLSYAFNTAIAGVAGFARPQERCLVPALGALVGALLAGVSPGARTDTMAVGELMRNGPGEQEAPLAHAATLVLRLLSASVVLGCGVSLGPTAPRLELGANTALMAQRHFLADAELTATAGQGLFAAGMAAAVSAGTMGPLAGPIFALEVCYLHPTSHSAPTHFALSGVLLASALASTVSQGGLLPATSALEAWTMGALKRPRGEVLVPGHDGDWGVQVCVLALLGALCGLMGVVFRRLQAFLDRSLGEWTENRAHAWVQPLCAGGAVSLAVACGAPEVMFLEWRNFQHLLDSSDAYSVPKLLQLLLLKPVLSSLCRKTGLVGGLFAPALFTGAVLGTLYGSIVPTTAGIHLPVLTVVGMAGCLGSIVGLPCTAVVLLLELTQSYALLPATVITVACGQFVQALLSEPAPPEVTAGRWFGRGIFSSLQLKYSKDNMHQERSCRNSTSGELESFGSADNEGAQLDRMHVAGP